MISVSVCQSVCLSVPSLFQTSHVQISSNSLYMLPIAVTWSSCDGSAIGYVIPVLWMTTCFHIMERMGQNQRLRSFTTSERSRAVPSRIKPFFSTSERFASRSLTPDETSPSALTLLRPKRATKRIATPTCLLFCAAMENSDEMYVFAVFCTYLVTFMKIVTDNSLSC